jgi:hypothetical protein
MKLAITPMVLLYNRLIGGGDNATQKRFRDIHFKPYAEQEFVEIAVEILDREDGVDRDVATLIADAVFNRLKSTNIKVRKNS